MTQPSEQMRSFIRGILGVQGTSQGRNTNNSMAQLMGLPPSLATRYMSYYQPFMQNQLVKNQIGGQRWL
jgi:hypothetical protein